MKQIDRYSKLSRTQKAKIIAYKSLQESNPNLQIQDLRQKPKKTSLPENLPLNNKVKLLWVSLLPLTIIGSALLYWILIMLPSYYMSIDSPSYQRDLIIYSTTYKMISGIVFIFIAYTVAPTNKRIVAAFFSFTFCLAVLLQYNLIDNNLLIQNKFDILTLLYGPVCIMIALLIPILIRLKEKKLLAETEEENKKFMAKIDEIRKEKTHLN
ncbi:hypothetical protein [Cellulophaga baltica]|uniref:hypothetical protein n=1 Tax=Cellulophaga baltica TaxID=76594 RepID=UPI002495509B|nr:hypothetical protein [Cellulophaga baltica]